METISVTDSIHQARSTKVLIGGITNESPDQILNKALNAANESRSSLFGWNVGEVRDGQSLVKLHTD